MTTSLMPEARQRYYNNDGTLAAGCLLYTYAAGTTTPKATYTDSAGLVPHENPIVLDAKGEAVIYFSGSYKVDLKTAGGVQITGYPVDNYTPPTDTLRTALAASTGAALVGGSAQVVSSITALRALLKTSASSKAIVTGYYANGDGGGGLYYYDSSDTTSADNGGTIIVATDGGRWKLAETNSVSIRQFGAVGDGSTDDTTAIQAAITYMATVTTRKRNLLINEGQFNFTTLTIPADCDFLTIRGMGRMASRLFSTTLTAGIAIDCLAQGVHYQDFRLMNDDFDTSTVLRHGFRFKKPAGETADNDCDLCNVEVSEFYYGVEHWGRGLNVQNCLFSICNYPINLNWPDVADYEVDTDTSQTDLSGFRAFRIQNTRFHSIGVAAIKNDGANAAKINGVIVTGNILDIGRTLWSGVLIDALLDGNVVNQTPTEGLLLTDGSKDYVVSNMVINGNTVDSPDRDPTNFIKLTGDHDNGVFRNLLLKNCDSHGIDIRDGTVTALVFENLMFVDPCQSVSNFCPIAFVGGGHTAIVRNVTVSTAYALTGIVRTDDATTFIQVDDCRSYGATIPAIVGTGKQYIDKKYAQAWMAGDGQVGLYAGSGTPEGNVTAESGSIYLRVSSGAGAGTSFYVKESGSGNTGWVAK